MGEFGRSGVDPPLCSSCACLHIAFTAFSFRSKFVRKFSHSCSHCPSLEPPGELGGHKATDTELTYAPVSQAYGHRHKLQFNV